MKPDDNTVFRLILTNTEKETWHADSKTNDRHGKITDLIRRRQIWRCVYFERRRPAGKRSRHGKLHCARHLSYVFGRRKMRFPVKDPFYQWMYLQLFLLPEQLHEWHSACLVHPGWSLFPYHGILPAQLYRRTFFEFRYSGEPELHDGADLSDALPAPRKASL